MPEPCKQTAHIKYRCTNCGAEEKRENLTVKRVMFQTMGVGFKTLRSRVVDWLCETCRSEDAVWNSEKMVSAPGMAETKLASGANG